MMEGVIAGLLHVIRVCGPLGIYVKHEETVISVVEGHTLYRFQGVVQGIRSCSGGIDTYTDQGAIPSGSKDVSVLRIKIGHIEPAGGVIVGIGLLSLL